VLVVAFGRLIAGMLYEVSPVDPVTLVLAPTLLLAIAALACYVPNLQRRGRCAPGAISASVEIDGPERARAHEARTS